MNNAPGKYYYTVSHYESFDDIVASLGFTEEGRQWYLYLTPRISAHWRTLMESEGLQVYYPVTQKEKIVAGRKVVRETPKIPRYVFVLGTFAQVDSLLKHYNIRPLSVHTDGGTSLEYDKIYQTIRPYEMRLLMAVVENLEEEVEFVTPQSQWLEKGDRVRVAAGRFKDVEGILLRNQGARGGGRIYIEMLANWGFRTEIVSDEYIQVLEFAHGSNHFYYKFQAAEKMLLDAYATFADTHVLGSEQRAALQYFLFRYEALTGLTFSNLAKYTACRYAALKLLHRNTEADELLQRYDAKLRSSKSMRRSARRSPAAQQYLDEWVERFRTLDAKSHTEAISP